MKLYKKNGEERQNHPSNQKKLDEEFNTLPNFTTQNASMISAYVNISLSLNILKLYSEYTRNFSNIHTSIINNFKYKHELMKEWERAIFIIRENIMIAFDNILPTIEGGCIPMTMDDTYINEFKKAILELKPIKIIDGTQGEEDTDITGVGNLISDIKDEIKKGNRVSFKLIQELQSTIENLSSHSPTKDKEAIENTIKGIEKKADQFMKVAIQAIDSMDLIYQSALKTNLEEWALQIKNIIQDFLNVLDSFGIEELKAEGAFFDGETMISIGTVSPDSAPHLKKFQVYSVYERGFRFKDGLKLIREAKVTTIY